MNYWEMKLKIPRVSFLSPLACVYRKWKKRGGDLLLLLRMSAQRCPVQMVWRLCKAHDDNEVLQSSN